MPPLKRILTAFTLLLIGFNAHANDIPPQNEWLNIYAIGWDNYKTSETHLRFAQAMGYRYVYHGTDYETEACLPYKDDLFFYYMDPHKQIQPNVDLELSQEELAVLQKEFPYTFAYFPMLPRAVDVHELARLKTFRPDVFTVYKNKFESTKSWSHPELPFPQNLAQLQKWGDTGQWEPCPDVQQQSVIDEMVSATIQHIKNTAEIPEKNYLCKGIIIDVIEIWDEFDWASDRRLPGKPNEKRYGIQHGDITHDYTTLEEGWYHYLATLRDAFNEAFPERDIKFVWDPTYIYKDWVQYLEHIPYTSVTPEMIQKIRGDALLSEMPDLTFLIDERITEKNGWSIHQLGSWTPDLINQNPDYPINLKYFGEIATRGAYFLSYAMFDRTWKSEADHPEMDIKLIRAMSGWENIHQTPLSQRTWDHEQQTYLSPTAYADKYAVAGAHPYRQQIYAAFNSKHGNIELDPSIQITGIRPTNRFFEPTKNQHSSLTQKGNTLAPAKQVTEYPASFIIDYIQKPSTSKTFFSLEKRASLTQRLNRENLFSPDLVNLDFEEGTRGWTALGQEQGAVIKSVSEPVQSGKKAAFIQQRRQAWEGVNQTITDKLIVSGSGKYRISGWVRPQSKTESFEILLYLHDETGKHVKESDTFSAEADQWTHIESDFEIQWEGQILNSSIRFYTPDSTTSFYIDNCSIEKVEE